MWLILRAKGTGFISQRESIEDCVHFTRKFSDSNSCRASVRRLYSLIERHRKRINWLIEFPGASGKEKLLGRDRGLSVRPGYRGGSAFGEAMAPHSSTLAWKIPWTEEPGRLQSMGQ